MRQFIHHWLLVTATSKSVELHSGEVEEQLIVVFANLLCNTHIQPVSLSFSLKYTAIHHSAIPSTWLISAAVTIPP